MKGGMGETMNQQQPIRPSKNLQDQRVRRTFHVLLKALEKLLCEMPLEELTIKKNVIIILKNPQNKTGLQGSLKEISKADIITGFYLHKKIQVMKKNVCRL